ncbi:MAG: hypothetical protein V3U16_04755 [Candidatus Neomarinimicrobiota bacterium]
MDKQQISEIVDKAINDLKEKDPFLLKHNISERAISHKLAVYLNNKFPNYTVDCEYNGYAKADNDKKYIMIIRQRIIELGKLKDSEKDEDLLKRLVYPDIIVHQRGQDNNLLIIEIKKKNNDDIEFDREKLSRYTSPDYENDLSYSLGALITFITGEDELSHEIEWYESGKNITI